MAASYTISASSDTRTAFGSIAMAGVGAALMYYFDPDRGRRRRALVRDQLARAANRTEDAFDTTGRDLRYRAAGVAAQVRAGVLRRPVSDEVLAERVRSRLGRVASHPGAIEVMALDGIVTLSGPVLSSEARAVATAVEGVSGVRGVIDRLEAHERPGDVPGLQGATRRGEPQPDPLQRNWSPTSRLLIGGAGALLGAWGLQVGGPAGWLLAATGALGAVRAATNLELARLLGVGSGRRAVDVRKEITIRAPVDEVFEFWSHFENFPRFMSHVKEVRDLGAGRSHWTVTGPAGTEWRWMALVTRVEPNQVLAWKSVAGGAVQHAGIVNFDENRDGSTTVHVRMSYNPPAGAIGHAVASFFGSDPKRAMDEDLVRLKSLLEEGKATGDRGPVMLSDVSPARVSDTGAEAQRRAA